jgi:hypothetical protein
VDSGATWTVYRDTERPAAVAVGDTVQVRTVSGARTSRVTTATREEEEDAGDGDALSSGAIVGIAVGVTAGVAASAALALAHRKNGATTEDNDTKEPLV